MTNIEDLAKNVYQNTDGIYYANSISKVSYPEDGNEKTFLLEENSFWFRHRNKVIIKAIKKYADGMHFFDIGGGNGYVAKGVQENNQDVTLVEPGIQGAQVAKKRGIKSVLCSTLDDAGFKPSSMETAGMFDVVEHVENDIDFLENIHGYLKESSRVFITVPAYNFLWSKEDVDAGHYRRYTLKSLKKVVTKAGFTPLIQAISSLHLSYLFSYFVLYLLGSALIRTLMILKNIKRNIRKAGVS